MPEYRRDILLGVPHLGVTLKTAWVMSHRAARQGALSALPPMGGAGETVEADETLIGRIEGEKKRPATPITRRASRKSESVIGCGGQKNKVFVALTNAAHAFTRAQRRRPKGRTRRLR